MINRYKLNLQMDMNIFKESIKIIGKITIPRGDWDKIQLCIFIKYFW